MPARLVAYVGRDDINKPLPITAMIMLLIGFGGNSVTSLAEILKSPEESNNIPRDPQEIRQAAVIGLLPIMWVSGAGPDVIQLIAAPTLGGMLTMLLLCL